MRDDVKEQRILMAGLIAGALAVRIDESRHPEDEPGGNDAETAASWALDIADEIIRQAGESA